MDKFKIRILPNKKIIFNVCSNILSMAIIIGIMIFISSCDDNVFIAGYNKNMEEIHMESDSLNESN